MKNIIKKTLVVSLALIMAFALFGCGSDNAKSDSEATKPSKTASQEIKTLDDLPPITDADKALMKKLVNKKNEGWMNVEDENSDFPGANVYYDDGTMVAYWMYDDGWVSFSEYKWRISDGKLYLQHSDWVDMTFIEFDEQGQLCKWTERATRETATVYKIVQEPAKNS